MALIDSALNAIFGNGGAGLRHTAGLFRENAEAAGARAADRHAAALAQFGAEFTTAPGRSRFDRIVDALNRLPRPALALGTVGLFVAAMVDPVWFAARMQGIALVPEPLWWLLGAIVSFYFGARHQAKGQEFQASLARSMARLPAMADDLARLRRAGAETPGVARSEGDADLTLGALRPDANPALEAWKHGGGRR
ncbi:Holin of 3TMs, for gene-transfer release [Lutimaribacter pacificus]|uniref:Holin of 3TMs, for gene-transfer release n=1 Tax=Lutimaribacter pacificus TaxID=391948 RepID=A0A1H0F1W9_9RHOB|nr:holin family protein [Lutimaribacter pacificus]SDN88605.1 Holin of 3TMs, for gene-transfer release [Lutimaribacter pacificus]SHK43699.1 Holin of 3TMs, for gene-transfer release [Lutimaribacter pacificus]